MSDVCGQDMGSWTCGLPEGHDGRHRKAPEPLPVPGIVVDGEAPYLLEEVLTADGPAFVHWDPGTDSHTIVRDPWDWVDPPLVPRDDELLGKGAVLLPSEPEEYGDAGQLFEGLVGWAKRWVDMDERLLRLAVLVTMTGWLYEKAPAMPILNPRGASETGKTRLATVLWNISFRGMRGDGALTFASLFRTAEQWAGTLVINEADFPQVRQEDSEASQILKYLNSRYESRTNVWRSAKEAPHETQVFRAYGPTILVSRKGFPDDALESRCLVLPMETTYRTDIPLNLPPSFDAEGLRWRNRLLLFRLRHYFSFENDYDLRFEGLQPRIQQILQPVASLAREVSPSLFAQIKALARELDERVVEDRAESMDGLIVRTWLEMKRESIKARPKATEIQKRLEDRGTKLSPNYIGQKIKILKFTRRKSGNARWYELDADRARRLIQKYCPKDEREVYLDALGLGQQARIPGYLSQDSRLEGANGTIGTDAMDKALNREVPPAPAPSEGVGGETKKKTLDPTHGTE